MKINIVPKAPKGFLHFDGVILFIAGLYFYNYFGFHWGLFFLLLLVPDLSMIGYLGGSEIGSHIYNLGHSMIWPVILIVSGTFIDSDLPVLFGIVWLCHIGMDHAIGYGFKYSDDFKHSHYSEL